MDLKVTIYSLLLLAFVACNKGGAVVEEPPPPPPAKPIADFFTVTGAPPFQTRIEFTNTTNGATSYFWQFGDGNSDTAKNPVHTYTKGGAYIVRLVANGAGGSDTIQKNLTVLNPPATCVIKSVELENHNGGTTLDNGVSFPDIYLLFADDSRVYFNGRNSYFLNSSSSTKRTWNFAPSNTISPLDKKVKVTFWDYDEVDKGDADDLMDAFVFNPSEYAIGANPFPTSLSFQGKQIKFTLYLAWY